jgi:hypothetical protein
MTMALCALLVTIVHSANSTERVITQEQKKVLESRIPGIAEQCIGIPYEFGNDFRKSGALDNSHLFCLIYEEAAKQAGLRFRGYMPMKELLKNSVEVAWDELRNGDLIVLNNGLAAMVYRVESRDRFHLIYASKKRQEVISFNSENLVYGVYWQENLKGFFRLVEGMFSQTQ